MTTSLTRRISKAQSEIMRLEKNGEDKFIIRDLEYWRTELEILERTIEIQDYLKQLFYYMSITSKSSSGYSSSSSISQVSSSESSSVVDASS